MSKWGHFIKSSFSDLRCCDGDSPAAPVVVDPGQPSVVYGWRPLASSLTCVLDSHGSNTGYAHYATLEKYDTATGLANGDTKPNILGDANYVSDHIDTNLCAVSGTITAHNGTSNAHTIIHLSSIDGLTVDIDLYPGQTKVVNIPNRLWTVNVVSVQGGQGSAGQFATTVNGNTIPLNFNEHHDFDANVPISLDVIPN
ncbi:hypothetical protein [Mucilaginibacter flavus]|uniref:hypothetical protein n=1 Tax=Mucilaginibacter flavus TaxID=931504 RepID=UPI0025B537EC|nr:hypothetical protein [Mucilaginibacter flavus]MDN3584732.1 hypothetical protein [Mucilaginibacter flavus]